MSERLQKLMSRAGYGSRRRCEMLITSGRVRVNGQVAHLGQKADSARDRIEVDGRIVKFKKPIYIMVNKPKGVISSTEDELKQGRRTVRELVPLPGHLYPDPGGRLSIRPANDNPRPRNARFKVETISDRKCLDDRGRPCHP